MGRAGYHFVVGNGTETREARRSRPVAKQKGGGTASADNRFNDPWHGLPGATSISAGQRQPLHRGQRAICQPLNRHYRPSFNLRSKATRGVTEGLLTFFSHPPPQTPA